MDARLWRLALLPVLAAGGLLSAPSTPVLGIIGDPVLLPCQVGATLAGQDFSIRWTFHAGRSRRVPVCGYSGEGRGEEPDRRYRGRAELFRRELRAGNASLLLSDVRSSDQGSYGCRVSLQGESWEVLVELQVAAMGESPSLILRGRDGRALGLSCRASGWFPRPELLWLDGRGRVRPEPSLTAATATPGGLFSVEGSVRVPPGAEPDISCLVLNPRLNGSRGARLRLHEAFLPSVSLWLQIFLALLFLTLALISGIFCLLQRSHKRTLKAGKAKLDREEDKKKVKALLDGEKAKKREAKIQFKERLGQLKAELDFWEARSHAAPVALGAEPRLLPLGDALVARDALGAGSRYWEVELGRERGWALGVLREPPEPRDPRNPREPPWLWALCASQGRLFSASRALGNHPRGLENHPRDLGNHPWDLGNHHPRDLGNHHPRDLENHPRDLENHPWDLGNHPRDFSTITGDLGNHPRDLGNHPRDLGNHPRDFSTITGDLGNHPRDLGNHPRDFSALTGDLSVLGNHPGNLSVFRDLSVLPSHPRDLSTLGNHPRDLSVFSERSRHLSVLPNDPGHLSVLPNDPGHLSVLPNDPGRLSVLGVLLDREKALLEFYDAERRQLLAGISLRDPPGHRDPLAGISPGKFFPFVSRGEEGALRIRPVPVPVPLPVPVPGPIPGPLPGPL